MPCNTTSTRMLLGCCGTPLDGAHRFLQVFGAANVPYSSVRAYAEAYDIFLIPANNLRQIQLEVSGSATILSTALAPAFTIVEDMKRAIFNSSRSGKLSVSASGQYRTQYGGGANPRCENLNGPVLAMPDLVLESEPDNSLHTLRFFIGWDNACLPAPP